MDIDQIKKVFRDNDVALSKDDAWSVQGTWVVKHKALERLGAAFRIKWDRPQVLRAERDEAVILVFGSRTDKDITEWSIGEALVTTGDAGGNYKVKGKMAAYPYAMAEKRAKDRVILKLAGLHGAYSEEEADDFKDPSQREFADEKRQQHANDEPKQDKAKSNAGAAKDEPAKQSGGASYDDQVKIEQELMTLLNEAKTSKAIMEIMNHPDTKDDFGNLPEDRVQAIRTHAIKLHKEWQAKEAPKAADAG